MLITGGIGIFGFTCMSAAKNLELKFLQRKLECNARHFSSEISEHFQSDAVSPMKPYCFENAPLLTVFETTLFQCCNGLDRRLEKGRRNRIESDAVTNKTAFV